MTARLVRLASLRRIALVGDLRALAHAERRVADLDAMAARLDALLGGVPDTGDSVARKAATTTRAALLAARARVASSADAAASARALAASTAACAMARADRVEHAAARARTVVRAVSW